MSANSAIIEITSEADLTAIDEDRLCQGVREVLAAASIDDATISIAVVADTTSQQLNRRYLDHDYATDVLSFRLSEDGAPLEGEIIVSAEMARRQAAHYGWSQRDELLLYVIHGALHLVGYEDASPESAETMRASERAALAAFGLEPRYEEVDSTEPSAPKD